MTTLFTGKSMGKHTTSSNYALIKSNPKEERIVDYSIVPEVKKVIEEILLQDRRDWEERGLKQFGIERSILLNKVCSKITGAPSEIFEIALGDLEVEQKVIPQLMDNFTRYFYLDLGNK